MKYFHGLFKEADLELTPGDDWRQLKYLLKHKAYIMKPARQLGIPFRTAIIHDGAKFTPSEWDPYSDFLFTPGGKQDPKARRAFLKAGEHHKAHSPHHFDRPGAPAGSDIPVHRLERVADGYAAAKANAPKPKNFPTFKDWYLKELPKQKQPKGREIRPVTDKYIKKKLREL